MSIHYSRRAMALCLGLLASVGLSAGARQNAPQKPAPRYRLLDLGFVPHNADDVGLGLNDAGEVAGWTRDAKGDSQATVWRGIAPSACGSLPGTTQSYAVALNGKGQAVGLVKETGDVRFNHAVLWQNGKTQSLGSLGGKYSAARALNDAGQIVGEALTAKGERHAFLWQNGAMTDLGTLLRGNNSTASDINASGQVVGAANLAPDGRNHAFLWEKGAMRDLGLLPGGSFSSAQAISPNGQVVGWADTTGSEIHAFLWQHGVMTDLGTLGDAPGAAWGVNSRGQVVGTAANSKQKMHAFLWEKGRVTDLNAVIAADSGWILRGATRINEAGQIAGLGWKDGKIHAFLLTPLAANIPSP